MDLFENFLEMLLFDGGLILMITTAILAFVCKFSRNQVSEK